MKILIVTFGFFPGREYGGPPVSTDNFCSLMKGDKCYIITRNHDYHCEEAYTSVPTGEWVDRGNCKVIYFSDKDYNKVNYLKIVKDIKPDIIYLQSLFQSCVLPCLEIAKKNNIKVILAPRGELCAGAFKKKYKKIPYIYYLRIMRLLDDVVFQSTSEEETLAIKKYLNANSNRIAYLTNIPSIPNKEYGKHNKEAGKANFVFLSRIHPKKNLVSAIRFFNFIKGEIVFDIYGPIEDESYWKECNIEINKLPSNICVRYCGLVSHESVHEIFSKYDAFIFPTFSENYGHVIAESLSVGTPVILSDQTPWNDVNEYNAGWSISLSDTNGFIKAIQTVVDMEGSSMRKMAQEYSCKKAKIDEIRLLYEQALSEIKHNTI